jgi:hypothetical protein
MILEPTSYKFTPANLHNYQRKVILHQLYHDDSMLWLGMSLGKTVITLTSIEHRMRAQQIQKTLIFGPVRVIHAVWEREARRWSHLQHLRFSVIHGTEEERLRALFTEADVYLCNYENMAWLSNILTQYYISQGKPLPFQKVVYDEISRVKKSTSKRVAGGKTETKKKITIPAPIINREYQAYIAAGWTDEMLVEHRIFRIKKKPKMLPAAMGYDYESYRAAGWTDDLLISHGMFKITKKVTMSPAAIEKRYIDHLAVGWDDDLLVGQGICKIKASETFKFVGWRKMIPHFKYHTGLTGTPASNGYLDLHGQYLCVDNGKRLGPFITDYKKNYFESDYNGWNYEPTDVGQRWIEHKIADITIDMKTEDYIELPETLFNDIMVELPAGVREKYDEVEEDMFTRLDCGTEIELFSRGSVSNKCLQFANGTPYKSPESPEWTALHDEKFQALDSIIEEAAGQPVAVAYCYGSDLDRMMTRYKHLNPVSVKHVPATKVEQMIKDWCAGKIKLLIGHPASMGHGLDGLQDYGDILVWFGLNWSLDLYLQMIFRFMRQGRTIPLTVHRILCEDTVDIAVADSLVEKDTTENGLRAAVNRYRQKKYNVAA